jgi:hypothetical protein
MMNMPNRIVIYPKDVALITGKQQDTARKLLSRIRKDLNKPPKAVITVNDFCIYMGLKLEEVKPFLIN